ncbi:chitin synthase (macronuclear) [Tetrahymena thermophila SB210]|uniref:chitin synthase n=1 Tax=Tetrahymena thermophila (strain SB210) TaxID=312017 RepID=I7M268_TETTS|nr:chitin synthase [Tetrahymena thermophila SB210]EAR99426.2 chitin synthase [Tetrahymena thermophila SB210]|eukprot:XP_001019671.2 chitin synthase [Tetrahymena thermophila SB210]
MNKTVIHDNTYVSTDRIKKILQPIELQLAKGQNNSFKLSSRTLTQQNWANDIQNKKFQSLEQESLSVEQVLKVGVQNGLVSLFNRFNDGICIKPKMIICVTMYNEPRKELEETLDGIVSNISTFKEECNISNNEILVIVVYDGIDRMNASKDSDDSMLDYFSTWDEVVKTQRQSEQRRTMRQEYDEYCYNLKISKLDVEKIKSNDFKEMNSDSKLMKGFNDYKIENRDDKRTLEQQKSEFLYKKKEEAGKYLKDKANNAYLYQMRHRLQKATSGGEDGDSQEFLDSDDTLNIMHCVKYQNGGKLSSHLWFFCGFCELFNPDYTILLDCGLVPDERAMFNMFLALESDKNIGGVCGFMGIKFQDIYTEGGERNDNYNENEINCIADMYQRVFNIQRAQMYEYNMGHFIDKPFESLFGYIQVLPGAFSGYRWEALKRDDDNESILDDYLSSVLDKDQELTLEQENMNLAEDRILCLKIYSKRGKRYTLRYLPNCKARVDPVTNLMVLTSQRRRWINGSTFALRMCLENKSIIYESNHSAFELCLFKFCMSFAWLNDALSYISLSVYFTIVFIMLMTNVSSVTLDGAINTGSALAVFFVTLFLSSYFLVVLMIIFYSLSFDTRNRQMHQIFYSLSAYLGVLMIIAYVIMLIYIIQITIFTIQKYILGHESGFGTDGVLSSWSDDGWTKKTFCYLVVVGFFINFVPYIFNLSRICEMLKSFIHFVAYQSQYIHLLLIYAFCRIDDLSWGTKGSDVSSSQKDVSKKIKFSFVTKWFLVNVILGFLFGTFLTSQVLDQQSQYQYVKPFILIGISVVFVGQLAIRVVGAVLYELKFLFFMIKMSNKKRHIKKERMNSNLNEEIQEKEHRFFSGDKPRKDKTNESGTLNTNNILPSNNNILSDLS